MPRKKLDILAATPEETPAPTKPSRRKKSAPILVESAPEISTDLEDVPVPVFRRPARQKATLGPSAEVVTETPVLLSGPSALNDEPVALWRPLKRASAVRDVTLEAKQHQAEVLAPFAQTKPAEAAKGKRGMAQPRAEAELPPIPELVMEQGEEFPVPMWRTATAGPAARTTTEDAESVDGSEEVWSNGEAEPAGRRDRDHRRGRRIAESVTVLSKTEDPLVIADVPPVPQRMTVQIPADAPQVILRDGVPTIVRDRRVYPPLFFFGNASEERRSQTVMEELRMAAEAGVHLHSFLVPLPVSKDAIATAVKTASTILAMAVGIDPEAQVMFRTVLETPRGWVDRYPDARYRKSDGDWAEPSICDDAYWAVAENCVGEFASALNALPQSKSILGLHLERGEWFLAEGASHDTSKAASRKFREWTRKRYLNDIVTLRASWFDGTVTFDNVELPDFRHGVGPNDRFIRSTRRHRRYVDYYLFLSDATVERIGRLAYTVKEATKGAFMVGVSYGYTFEWSHPGTGHLSLGKLLRTPEIDMIAGPPSYRSREPGGTAAFPGPIDSFPLNGKLFLSEEDFRTSLGSSSEFDERNPSLKTPQALENVHWRGLGAAMAHSSGVSWMDLWGQGWLKSRSIWDRSERVIESLIQRMAVPPTDPDVAIFIDERSLAYLVDPSAFTLLVHNVRESVLRAGVSSAFYLLSDLQHRERFPESKLYVFLNAWDVRPELRSAIKNRLQRDGKVLFWLYAAGLFDAGRDTLERAREVTGIALKPQPFFSKSGTTLLNRRHPLTEAFPNKTLIGGTKLEPSYFAIPEDATVLGEYTQTGLPSFVVREFREGDESQQWTSVFLGEPMVNPALIRALTQMAGAHVWDFHGDLVHVRPPFLTVHCSGTGPRAVALPEKCSAFNLATRQWATVDSTNLRFHGLDGSTSVFMIGLKDELEQQLQTRRSDLLNIETLPPREPNVMVDISNFDVPIMKLDEWIESSEPDEIADEWFLRAPQITEEPETATADAERPGRRRRRRRRGGGGASAGPDVMPGQGAGQASEDGFDSLGMNVVFRKREA